MGTTEILRVINRSINELMGQFGTNSQLYTYYSHLIKKLKYCKLDFEVCHDTNEIYQIGQSDDSKFVEIIISKHFLIIISNNKVLDSESKRHLEQSLANYKCNEGLIISFRNTYFEKNVLRISMELIPKSYRTIGITNLI